MNIIINILDYNIIIKLLTEYKMINDDAQILKAIILVPVNILIKS